MRTYVLAILLAEHWHHSRGLEGFRGGSTGKEPTRNVGDAGDAGSILGLEGYPGGGHGNPLQYSCLEIPMDRGAWRAAVSRVATNWTPLK